MSRRKVLTKPLRKIALGDMNTPVKLLIGRLGAPFHSINIDRENVVVLDPWFCKVETVSGLTLFGQSNVEEIITHRFTGRFLEGVTTDNMIEYQNAIHRIVTIENFEQRDQYLVLNCTARGPASVEVNQA